MITIRPFPAWRPAAGTASRVASPPYDVLSSEEARVMAGGNSDSFLHVIKPEIDLPVDTDLYSDTVYGMGRKNWDAFCAAGTFVQDAAPCLYFYRQAIDGHEQTGIVAASLIDDYFADRIKKHEFTRPKKENDRIRHMETLEIHPGPVFLTYKHRDDLDERVAAYTAHTVPDADFTADDGVRHTLWVVNDPALIDEITGIFASEVEATYIADGHHRAAASAKTGRKLREERGHGKHDFFLSVLFPDDQLRIIDYNRLVTDLNGHTPEAFLKAITAGFEVEKKGPQAYKPAGLRDFGMYLDGEWYQLKAKPHTFEEGHPIRSLDVTVISDHLILPVLGIEDQRTDERIDFVGGIRGLGELQKRVDSGEMAVAFALYPVSIAQLIAIADAGEVMPPKSTWFEPKLRSGLVVHSFRN